jgi:hypothetical protein
MILSGRVNFERICQIAVLLLGAQCAYAGRDLPVGADGLAYMDVARAYLQHDWHTAVNGYWGPLYAWLLAIAMSIFRPGASSEFALARALNFAIFAVSFYMFTRYWRAVADWSGRIDVEKTSSPASIPQIWMLFGYLLFTVDFIWSVDVVNPDLLVATVVFAVATFLFERNARTGQAQQSAGSYAWLSVMLAAGYYVKAILLYFAVFVLGAIFIQHFRSRRLRQPIIASVVFVGLITPFVVITSQTLGHLSAGDSGRLNYAWFVNGPETGTWEKDQSGGAPIPFYPGPTIFESPRVFQVPSIEGITYAPWYDASRFDKRSHPVFNLRQQLEQFAGNLRYSREQLLGAGAVLTVPLLILVLYEPRASLRRFAASWFCTLPALGVFGMYLLVHLVERFVIGFSLVLWGAAWASVYLPREHQLLARRAVLAASVVLAAYSMPGLLHYVVSRQTESIRKDVVIAQALSGYRLAPGDLVASIGNGQEAYWAHFARLSVVAEVWSIDSAQFWSAPPDVQSAALRSMAAAGAKAAVWRADSIQPCPAAWAALPENSGCIISLR